jgi:hypothetical protein
VVAFLHGWTVSLAVFKALELGLPLLEEQVSAEDRQSWADALSALGELSESDVVSASEKVVP